MHRCPDCNAMCHCLGDIDDLDFGEWDGCIHYEECERDDYDYDDEDEDGE